MVVGRPSFSVWPLSTPSLPKELLREDRVVRLRKIMGVMKIMRVMRIMRVKNIMRMMKIIRVMKIMRAKGRMMHRVFAKRILKLHDWLKS